jgi:large subunit ribosomal protein L17
MPHNIAHRKLGRVTEHRIALLRSQATALLRHERIETTLPKAKELRPFVERLITLAKRGVASGEPPKTLHARRLVARDVQDTAVVSKLFETLAPRFATRPGGYTRILRLGFRRGDSAEVAQIELVGSEYDPNAAVEKKDADAAKPKKTVGDRLKAAAQRMRGTGKKGDDGEKKSGKAHTKAEGGRKVTTPRKAGGS